MKTETWKKIAKVGAIVGLVGGAASLGAGIINTVKPETVDIPASHQMEMKKIALEALEEASKNKS